MKRYVSTFSGFINERSQNEDINENERGDKVDLKIYQSELNLLNKIKPTDEKHLKRKKFLEKEIERLSKN